MKMNLNGFDSRRRAVALLSAALLMLILLAIPETMVILGFVVAVMILILFGFGG